VIDVDVYLEISDLFRFRYDPAVLSAIAERPYRFRDLVTRLEGQVAGHVDDNAVSRSLRRLADDNHVRKAKMRDGNKIVPVYSITDQGRLSVRLYHAFIDAYRRIQRDGNTA
jgi:DNA-binding HxlR family transcriptional regulator